MNRNFVLFAVASALACSSCKRLQQIHLPWKKAAAPTPVQVARAGSPGATASAATVPAASAPGSTGLPEAPPKPDFPASAATPGAPATASTVAVKPPIDNNASAIALCYHNIEDSTKMKALTLPVGEFEKEMKEIKDNGFTVIPMQDFIAWRRGEKNIPHKSCIITLDDGWVSAYNNAWPILKKYNYPFTVFIYINYVGTGGKSMSWAQLEEMRDAGVDIESHTYSHANLRSPSSGVDRKAEAGIKKDIATLGMDGWLHKEIFDSKQVLEKQLGIKVNAFAYPFGNYTPKAREMIKQAGYEAAFTVYGQRLTRSSPFDLLGRYALEAANPKIFQEAMSMIGGGVSASEAPPDLAQLAASSMVTEPANNAVLKTAPARVMANVATMGNVEPRSLKLRVSGLGELAVQYNSETKTVTAALPPKLKPGAYSVIISATVDGQRAETRWNFTFNPAATPSSPADAPLPPPNVLGR